MTEAIQNLIEELCQAAQHPRQTVIAAIRHSGKRAIGCFPPYIPEETIYASGFLPVGLWGGKVQPVYADHYVQSFCCSILRANMEYGSNGTYDILEAIAIPSFCDAELGVHKNWSCAIPKIKKLGIAYPQNRGLDAGIAALEEEFRYFLGKLENLSGKKVTDKDLEYAFEVYENYRAGMRKFVQEAKRFPVTINAKIRHLIIKAAWFMDKAEYTQRLSQLTTLLQMEKTEPYDGLRVVITGIMADAEPLLDLFVENKIAVVSDDLAQESRQFRVPAREGFSALRKMAYRHADLKGCAMLYDPEKLRGKMLLDMVRQDRADGVVVSMMKFCDVEECDYPIYKKELEDAKVPHLYIESDMYMETAEQLRTRVQSFAEMLGE